MALDAVVAPQHADDAALRPGGGGLGQLALGQHHHGHPVGQMQGHRQTGQTGPDDHHRGRIRISSMHEKGFLASRAATTRGPDSMQRCSQ